MPKAINKLAKFTDEELYAELQLREVDKESIHHKTLNIDGFTGKDVVCMEGGAHDADDEDEYGPYYHFYLKVDGKLFDAYYMNCVSDAQQEINPSRWPEKKDYHSSAALEFVPSKFAESMENSYEYHGKEDVKKYLAKHGISDYRVWKADLVNGDTGEDGNYSTELKA